MPSVSHRAQTVPLSPFRKLIPLADRAKAAGRHVYHLNIGQPDIPAPADAIARFRALDWKLLPYGPSAGYPAYRHALTDYFRRFDIELTTDQIMVTTGGSEAILFFLLTCLDPGDEIIVPEPFYANYNGFAHVADVRIVPITSYIEDGFKLPDPAAFAARITPRTRAIMITNPNNPTGSCYDEKALRELAEIVKANDLFFCCDEVYREFAYEKSSNSILQFTDLADHAIVVDSVSKRYSATGARVGALVSRNAEVIAAVDRFAKLRLSPPGLGQWLSQCMLENDTVYLETVKADYEARRDLVYRRLCAMPGVYCYLPGGAFYSFARFPIEDAEDFCRWLLEDFEHQGATVMLSPGQGFYATPGLGNNECRLAYVLNTEDLEKAMDCLEVALETYQKLER